MLYDVVIIYYNIMLTNMMLLYITYSIDPLEVYVYLYMIC